ncbi:uncharacterized protein LOC114540491 [Dendronephthya gigantea]|uniref:uncharacterized protein LOC114540491 n=1 Tax=Dendronephthya gigantea TaxID=151771 RepID=UPI00106A95A6|nr:uncharacterized protein LOC114540491 [Dendronephthya gigantea]
MDEAECFSEFRVQKHNVVRLADALGLPESFTCPQRTKAGRIEGLCIYLKRLTYPCRLSDMIHRFGRAVPELSMISSNVEHWIYRHHHQRITQWNEALLNSDALQFYAEAISQAGAALTNCFGFIDGTVRPICRPGDNQRVVYNGHKRVHALKFQSLTIPSGIIANLFGPVEGRKHDASMLRDSNLLTTLEEHAFSPVGEPMCIYGDPAYPLRVHLQAPFRDRVLTPQMQAFNQSMSSVRESVDFWRCHLYI